MNPITMRPAQREDVSAIIHLLADDPIGQTRENIEHPLSHAYLHAFDAMAQDARSLLAVATLADDIIIGCLHLTFIPGLSHHGAMRLLIEDVRVDRRYRRQGIGRQMIAWAIDQARDHGCHIVQLFVHESRHEAAHFYARLGFEARHRGMRLMLD